jgi:YHS domain-containing protein
MKSKLMLLVMTVFLLSGVQVRAEETMKSETAPMNEENVVKICPVCGPEANMKGKDDLKYEFEGKTYHFCSEFCLDEFKLNPAKYTKMKEEKVESKDNHQPHDDHKEHKGHDHDHDHKS